MRNRLKAKKQLLGGFVGNAGFSAKADLGLFRASAEIRPGNRPELQTHVKIRAVFLQNHPELQGRGKSRATATKTVQNSRAATDAAQPQVSETNEAGTPRRCRPRVKPCGIAKSSAAFRRPHAAVRHPAKPNRQDLAKGPVPKARRGEAARRFRQRSAPALLFRDLDVGLGRSGQVADGHAVHVLLDDLVKACPEAHRGAHVGAVARLGAIERRAGHRHRGALDRTQHVARQDILRVARPPPLPRTLASKPADTMGRAICSRYFRDSSSRSATSRSETFASGPACAMHTAKRNAYRPFDEISTIPPYRL